MLEVLEVGMLNSLADSNALIGRKGEHFGEEIERERSGIRYLFFPLDLLLLRQSFQVIQRVLVVDEVQVFVARKTHHFDDLVELLHVVHAREKSRLQHHFAENAAYRPHIQCLRVMLLIKHHFRRSVPPRDHIYRLFHECLVFFRAETACKTEVAHLEVAVHIHKNVRRLKVSVHYIRRVKEKNASKQLVHEILVVIICQLLLRVYQLVQVCLH